MKTIINISILVVTAALLSSCSVAFPLENNQALVTKNSIGSKEGVAKRKIWLGIAFGHTDLSMTTAAKKGGITKIATVDYKIKGGFLNTTYIVTVTGE